MKARRKVRSIVPILTLMLAVSMALPAVSVAAEAPVNLGTTSSYAILAYTTITNTGATVIDGDAGNNVGLHPGNALTGFTSTPPDFVTMVGGTIHAADAVALQAKNDLVTAYNDAAGRALTATIDHDLSNITLTPGVYDGAEGGLLVSVDQTLTLDAQNNPDAVFILRSTSDLTFMSGATVRLINGARYCRVFWVVPSSASIGTDANFVGHLFAMTSITVANGAHVQGQLLARNGTVTLDTNHITNGLCAAARSLSITKSARDVNGGSLMAGDAIEWTLTVKNTGTESVTNAIVRDAVPSNTTYVAGSMTGIGATAAGAPNLQWNVGTIAPGATVVLAFRSTVNAGLPKGTEIRNQGTVISDQTPLQVSDFPATTAPGDVTLLRTGADDRVWLGLASLLVLAAAGFWALDRRRLLHA
jgi:uncharacterized repeat protein (TIGR01451 family)